MITYNKIRSMKKPEKIVIDDFNVYINTDIQQVKCYNEDQEYIEYEFNQQVYSKDEYITAELADNKNKNQDLETKLTDIQLAMCEIYESLIKL